MSQYLRGRGLPVLAALTAGGGLYWSGNNPNRGPAVMRASEAIQTIGSQGGRPGGVNNNERVRDIDNDPKNTKLLSHRTSTASKRDSSKTRG